MSVSHSVSLLFLGFNVTKTSKSIAVANFTNISNVGLYSPLSNLDIFVLEIPALSATSA